MKGIELLGKQAEAMNGELKCQGEDSAVRS